MRQVQHDSEFIARIPKSEEKAQDIYRSPEPALPVLSTGLQKLTIEQLDYRMRRQEALKNQQYSTSQTFSPNDFKNLVLSRTQQNTEKQNQLNLNKTPKQLTKQIYEPEKAAPPRVENILEINFFDRYKDLQKSEPQVKNSPMKRALSPVKTLQSMQNSLSKKENGQQAFIIPYQAPDRTLVMALMCEYDIQKESGIPHAGSVRVQRKADLKEKQIQEMQYMRAKNFEKNQTVEIV